MSDKNNDTEYNDDEKYYDNDDKYYEDEDEEYYEVSSPQESLSRFHLNLCY